MDFYTFIIGTCLLFALLVWLSFSLWGRNV